MGDSIRYLKGETLGKSFWLRRSRPLTCSGCLRGERRKETPGQGWLGGGRAGRRARVPAARASSPRRPFGPRLTQDRVAQQEAGASLFCFAAFARSRTGPRVRGGGGGGVTGSQPRAPRRALSPPPPGPPLVRAVEPGGPGRHPQGPS